MAHAFRFGVVNSGAQSGAEWVARARRAEELGYSTMLMVDRLPVPLAPLTALAMAAGATTTLRVGSHVFCNDYRHPVLLAKEAATLDFLSGGRFELALGSGVGESDFQQLGLSFDSAGTRVSRLEEALRIIKPLLRGETANVAGTYYTVTNVKGTPRPVQQPHPPIFLAGSGKRMLTIAAREADIIAVIAYVKSSGGAPEDVPLEQKIAWVREAAGERFSRIEFAHTAYYLSITDSPVEATPFSGWSIPQKPMSTEQAIEYLQEQRQLYGFSYIQIADNQMENFAPVVARLAGH
ncbi:MAG TPA: TIGR03621 family F420-dependent LLM class oxidoreductase [Ktedonobacteraceae bacterium]